MGKDNFINKYCKLNKNQDELDKNKKGSSYIKRLKDIKEKLDSSEKLDLETIKFPIENISTVLWENISNVYKDDLKEVYVFHEFLIEEILKIRRDEESELNYSLIMENINMKVIEDEMEDGKSSDRIYFFRNDDYEYYFIGDIHSDNYIIDRIIEEIDLYKKVIHGEKVRLIFLGDYVDRGKEHLKTLEKIMVLKYIFPGNIFLLSGNHDGGDMKDDEVSLCIRKPTEDKPIDYFILYLDEITKKNPTFPREIITKYLQLFKATAVLAFVSYRGHIISGVHGGIPRPLRGEENIYGYITSLSRLTDESIINFMGETIINNILWSDPIEVHIDPYENRRRFGFREEEFNRFSEIIGIDILIRGHQVKENGFESFFNDKLYSVFSSGAILEEGININPSTAYEWVKPKIIMLGKDKLINIMDLNSK